MLRIIFLCAVVMLLAVGCAPAGASAAFLPTPFLPTLAPTPQGLAAPTPLPPPTATAAPTQAPTQGPTSSASPTNTPTNTPVLTPQAFMIAVTDNQIAPSTISVPAGQFIRLMFQNQGSVDFDLVVQNLKPDNVFPDESMAGKIPSNTLDKINNDAGNGVIHLAAVPQGTAFVTFTPKQKGTFPFTVNIAGHQLSGSIVVQ